MASDAWPADALEVARIVDAWGLKGWIKVQPFSAEPDALLAARRWHLQPPLESVAARLPAAVANWPGYIEVAEAKLHGDCVVARVGNLADRTAAEALRGGRVFIPRSSFPATAADEFYWVDLIGLDVVNRDGAHLGRVDGLLENGPQSVLRVVPAESAGDAGVLPAERLIPFVSAYVDDVDLGARRISVDWGLDF